MKGQPQENAAALTIYFPTRPPAKKKKRNTASVTYEINPEDELARDTLFSSRRGAHIITYFRALLDARASFT